VGVISGTWHFAKAQGDLPADELAAIAAIARRLEAATGLLVEQRYECPACHWLCVPAIREELFEWAFYDRSVPVEEQGVTVEELEEMFEWGADDRAVMVQSFIPEHPTCGRTSMRS
jgi:hypothetical protein